jgi:hypothetical protein
LFGNLDALGWEKFRITLELTRAERTAFIKPEKDNDEREAVEASG